MTISTDSTEGGTSSETLKHELISEVNRLNGLSTRGFTALALFLVICVFVRCGFSFLPPPETIIAYLGKPPSPRIVSMVLILYTFIALILSLSRMMSGVEHRSSFSHLGYLTGFFIFYYFGKSLDDNFWAVFGSGITILGVESYRIWSYCSEAIAKKREDIEYVTRTGKVPPQE